jgi:putative ABC transport system permease protein
VNLNGAPHTVIGVISNAGWPLSWSQVDAFTSLGQLENMIGGPERRGDHNGVYAYARMKPGVTFEEAREQMWAIARRLDKQYPQTNTELSVTVYPLLAGLTEYARRPLLLLMIAVGLVLLIACANVANLLTSLAIVRRREIAVRSALGAGAARLARQFLCESVLLALMGGGVGLLAAYCSIAVARAALAHLASSTVPRIDEISIDHSVLSFTLAVSLLTGIVFGIFPALTAFRTDAGETLKDSSRNLAGGPAQMGLRNVLVALELALSLVLLVATGLTIKSLFYVVNADVGFHTAGVLTASLNLPKSKYTNDEQRRLLVQPLVAKVATLPGVTAAGFKYPLLGPSEATFLVEGRPQPPRDQEPYTEMSSVTPGGLEAMGVKLLGGRYFTASDDADATPVCIVDELLARQYWPGANAVGKRISTEMPTTPSGQRQWRTVVGVVNHVDNHGADWPSLAGTYLPFAQYTLGGGTLVIHSQGDRASLEGMVREVLRSLDPDLALYDVRPLADLTDQDVAPRRLSSLLLGILAGIALLLASLGTYGVTAYVVTGRTHEIGLRRALGATPRDVLGLVLREGMCSVLVGVLVGTLASLALARVIRGLLFGVSATDPATFVAVAALLALVALVACYIPARRAMHLEPVDALRCEFAPSGSRHHPERTPRRAISKGPANA